MMFRYVSKREHEALKADNARQRDTINYLEDQLDLARTAVRQMDRDRNNLSTALAEARAKQPQRGDKGRFVEANSAVAKSDTMAIGPSGREWVQS